MHSLGVHSITSFSSLQGSRLSEPFWVVQQRVLKRKPFPTFWSKWHWLASTHEVHIQDDVDVVVDAVVDAVVVGDVVVVGGDVVVDIGDIVVVDGDIVVDNKDVFVIMVVDIDDVELAIVLLAVSWHFE